MKLLELIVKNVKREDIPSNAKWFMQDLFDGLLKSSSDKVKPKVYPEDMFWTCEWVDSRYGKFFVSEDAATTIITREELMRAYNMVDDGFTLWFGGESPVDDGVIFDVVYSNGDIRNFCVSGDVSWSDQIIAYKVADVKNHTFPEPIKDVEVKMSSEIKMYGSVTLSDTESLMRDITKAVPEMMAADIIELADYLIAQGWGKHE